MQKRCWGIWKKIFQPELNNFRGPKCFFGKGDEKLLAVPAELNNLFSQFYITKLKIYLHLNCAKGVGVSEKNYFCLIGAILEIQISRQSQFYPSIHSFIRLFMDIEFIFHNFELFCCWTLWLVSVVAKSERFALNPDVWANRSFPFQFESGF